MKAETLKVQIQSAMDATNACTKSIKSQEQLLYNLNKEEDSIEGEWSKETAVKDARFEGEEGEVRRCKEDQVQV